MWINDLISYMVTKFLETDVGQRTECRKMNGILWLWWQCKIRKFLMEWYKNCIDIKISLL